MRGLRTKGCEGYSRAACRGLRETFGGGFPPNQISLPWSKAHHAVTLTLVTIVTVLVSSPMAPSSLFEGDYDSVCCFAAFTH